MAGQDDNKGSGNDGSWFLEAVGAVPRAPTPSETVAALESDNTLPDIPAATQPQHADVTVTGFDGGTGTSTSTYETPRREDASDRFDDTSEMEITTPPPPIHTSLESDELSPVLETKRSFRWPAVAFGLFIIVVLALAALWLPAVVAHEAAATKQAYADASLALRQYLPESQHALDLITDPDSSPEALSSAVPTISQLDSLAHELEVAATAPLPRTLPFIPNDAVSALEPLQQEAQLLALRASDVAGQLGHAYVYRTTIPTLLDTGPLPVTADNQTINALSVSLASSLVDNSSAVNDLPTTAATSALNESARSSVERYATWQEEYLNALSEGDEPTATELIAELEGMRASLNAELAEMLGVARIEIDQEIVQLATDLEGFVGDLTQS